MKGFTQSISYQESKGAVVTESRIEKSSFNQRKIHTEILIDASSEKVWRTLTDIESSSRWSHSIILVSGIIKDGEDLTVKIKLSPKIPFTKKYHHKIYVRAGQCFGWDDTRILGAHDKHKFIVERVNDRTTRFIHSDELIGGMTWLIGDMKMRMLKTLYTRFNRELKEEAER